MATDLDDEDKQETLEQINSITASLQNPQDAADLPDNADLVSICNQLPDLMGKIF